CPEHVGGGSDGPKPGEPAAVMQALDEMAADPALVAGHHVVMCGEVGVAAALLPDRPRHRVNPWADPADVGRELAQRAKRGGCRQQRAYGVGYSFFFVDMVVERDEEIGSGREVKVDRTPGHPGPFGRGGHRECGRTVLLEQRASRVE